MLSSFTRFLREIKKKTGKGMSFSFPVDTQGCVICVLRVLFISHLLGMQTLSSWVNTNTQPQEGEEAAPDGFMA